MIRLRLGLLDPLFRMCTGKMFFRSRAKARKWIRRDYIGAEREKMYIYECPHCAGFHLTKKRPR